MEPPTSVGGIGDQYEAAHPACPVVDRRVRLALFGLMSSRPVAIACAAA